MEPSDLSLGCDGRTCSARRAAPETLGVGAGQMSRVDSVMIAGVKVPAIALNGHDLSAPIKVELALQSFGLKP